MIGGAAPEPPGKGLAALCKPAFTHVIPDFAACGGREEGRSEDDLPPRQGTLSGGEVSSRSVKGLQAPCNPAYSRSCNSPWAMVER
jgi:hypothetical protein